MGENGLKFTPPERSIVLVMHERTVCEIRVNENTALNLEDVIENVIGIETVVRGASFQNSTVEMDLWGKTTLKHSGFAVITTKAVCACENSSGNPVMIFYVG